MAITGDGSQEYPWLVHSYEELRTVTTDRTYLPNYGKAWAALDADINCNDYGADFEWETINLGVSGSYSSPYGAMSFDLNGHTIKNIPVKLNNSLFNANFTASNSGDAEFKGNGKLLNVFTQPSSTAYLIIGRNASHVVSNLSMSVNLGNNSKGVFRDTALNGVACYIESGSFTVSSDVNALILSFSQTGDTTSDYRIKDSDFYTNVNNLQTALYSAYHQAQRLVAIDSRFRGKLASSSEVKLEFISCGYMSNCVVDIDFLNFTATNAKISRYSCNGVINGDKVPSSGFGISGLTSCTSSEIVNGEALRGKNFTVVNVVGG